MRLKTWPGEVGMMCVGVLRAASMRWRKSGNHNIHVSQQEWTNEIFSQNLQLSMFYTFLFPLSLKYFTLKNAAGSVCLAEGMACAKALGQEIIFPVRTYVKAWLLFWRPHHSGHLSV